MQLKIKKLKINKVNKPIDSNLTPYGIRHSRTGNYLIRSLIDLYPGTKIECRFALGQGNLQKGSIYTVDRAWYDDERELRDSHGDYVYTINKDDLWRFKIVT